jgi:hypothetical protein
VFKFTQLLVDQGQCFYSCKLNSFEVCATASGTLLTHKDWSLHNCKWNRFEVSTTANRAIFKFTQLQAEQCSSIHNCKWIRANFCTTASRAVFKFTQLQVDQGRCLYNCKLNRLEKFVQLLVEEGRLQGLEFVQLQVEQAWEVCTTASGRRQATRIGICTTASGTGLKFAQLLVKQGKLEGLIFA